MRFTACSGAQSSSDEFPDRLHKIVGLKRDGLNGASQESPSINASSENENDHFKGCSTPIIGFDDMAAK